MRFTWTRRCLLISVIVSFGGSIQTCYFYEALNCLQPILETFLEDTIAHNFGLEIGRSEIVWIWPIIMLAIPTICSLMWSSLVNQRALNAFGRKPLMLLGGPIFIITAAFLCLLTKWTHNSVCFAIACVLMMIAYSMSDPIAITYLSEIAPTNRRAFIGSIVVVFRTMGAITGALMGSVWMMGTQQTWHYCLALIAVPSFIVMLMYPIIPESPKYIYVIKRDTRRTERCLHTLGVPDDEMATVMANYEKDRQTGSIMATESRASICDMLREKKHIRLNVFIVLVSSSFAFCSARLLNNYSTVYLIATGLPIGTAQMFNIIRNILNLFGTVTTVYIMEHVSRRLCMIASLSATCSIILLSGIFGVIRTDWTPYLSGIAILVANSLASAPRCFSNLLANEVTNTRLRAAASTFNYVVRTLSYMPQILLINWLLSIWGTLCVAPWSIGGLLTSVALYFIMPETRNRNADEVYAEITGQAKEYNDVQPLIRDDKA